MAWAQQFIDEELTAPAAIPTSSAIVEGSVLISSIAAAATAMANRPSAEAFCPSNPDVAIDRQPQPTFPVLHDTPAPIISGPEPAVDDGEGTDLLRDD